MGQFLEIAFWLMVAIGVYATLTSATLYLRDRSGNSGRDSHWLDNPRIDGPDEK